MYRAPRSILAFLVVMLALSSSIVFAGAKDQPPPIPGWVHTPRLTDDTPQQHGIKLSGSKIEYSSPVIAEIDGDLANGREVAVGGNDGILYVYGADGTRRWSTNVLPVPCASSDAKINSAPAVGNLRGTGVQYVVVSYGTVNESSGCEGGVAVYDGRNGALAWNFRLKLFGQSERFSESNVGVVSSPALADTDGDGFMEIAFGGLDRNLYLLNFDGTVRWYYHVGDTVWSSPAFVNIDADPALELVTGSDITANPTVIPATSDGGFVYAFDTQPRTPKRIEFQTGFIWRTFFDQVIFSSPSIGDVLPNNINPGQELVVGTGCIFPYESPNKRGKALYILRLSDGRLLQRLNASACLASSPALGDLDEDGLLEIVAPVNGSAEIGGDGKGRISAWKGTNPDPIWSKIPTDPNSGSNDPRPADLQSASIADVDGNGSLEVVVANFWSVHIFDRNGNALTCQNPQCGTRPSLFAWATLKGTPAIGDVNGDGKLDIVIGGAHIWYNGANSGMLYGWTNLASVITSPPGNHPPYSAPWPMFRGNPQRTGVFVVRQIQATPEAISILSAGGVARTMEISFALSDASPISWNVSKTDPQNMLRFNRTTGTGTTPLQVTIDPPATPGTYRATIRVQASGLTLDIPVTVTVVNAIRTIRLPLVIR